MPINKPADRGKGEPPKIRLVGRTDLETSPSAAGADAETNRRAVEADPSTSFGQPREDDPPATSTNEQSG
jgi:hypothetical protein